MGDTERAMEIKQKLKETDNALKSEWFSLFPSLETLKIKTNGYQYAFRLDVLLKTMKKISPKLTVIVADVSYNGKWAKKAMCEDVVAQYHAAGWTMEYDDKYAGAVSFKGA